MNQPQSVVGGTTCLDFVNHSAERLAESDPGTPPEYTARIQRFRVILRRLLNAEARGIGAAADDLDALNRVLSAAGGRRGLITTVRGYGWGWLDENGGPERALWPVAFSAARLLESPDLARLKACGGCDRLFLDGSRNRSRRWCDMLGCGNREKQRRWRGGQSTAAKEAR